MPDVTPARSAAQLLIDGQWRGTSTTFDVLDPATLEVIGQAADAGSHDALDALDAATLAFETWRSVTAEERAGYLRTAAAAIRANTESLAALLTSENGKPLGEARGEITGCARMLEWAAEEGRRADGRSPRPVRAVPVS